MANPRKFSEKIALHNHRQAEETAAFEQIMKEVNEVTTKVIPDRSSAKNTLRINSQLLGAFRGGSLPNVSAATPSVKSPPQNTEPDKDEVPLHNSRAPVYRQEGRSRTRSQGGPIRRPHDRKLDTSPYSSSSGTPGATYLSLPTDTGWRRTASDSALHTSTMQGMVDRNNDMSCRGWNIPMMNGPDRSLMDRPRSSCDIPSASRVPGISIHPTVHDPSLIQIPIANTGSLPDLTNVDFPSPIHAPLDQDHDSSPYSSSPVNTSPSTLSPTSMPQGVRPLNRFHFTPVSHSNHLSVPLSPRYRHHHNMGKNIHLDNKNVMNLVETDFTQLQDFTGMYQQCPSTSPSPTLQTATYRSPRPSPQSSPSPGGRHSAPCSPGAPSPLPNEYHILNHQATQFQQHFEQLSMDWAQLVASLMESGVTWSAQLQLDTPPNNTISFGDQSNTAPMMSQSQHQTSTMPDGSSLTNIDLSSDADYYSSSPSQQLQVYQAASPSAAHPTTPNTPTSLPEIILTDFSGDDMSRQDSFSRALASDFFSEELKEGLGSLDFDEIQILTNPSIGIPEIVEDNFRLDHRS